MKPSKISLMAIGGLICATLAILLQPTTAQTQGTFDDGCWDASTGIVYVPETGHHIQEPFLSTWRQYDLSIVGYPVSEQIDVDGTTVQYFERARFEHHPEYAGTQYEVLLTLLGDWIAENNDDPAFEPLPGDIDQPDSEGRYYPETGHYLQLPFRNYWDEHGGLPVFGYPISEMFFENGFLVQYFERARFERHPEHAGTRYEIELGHLGRERADADGIDQQPVDQLDNAVDYRWNPEPRSFFAPTLMYHKFGGPTDRYTVSYWDFEQQLIWLRDNGYTPMTMTEVYNAMFGGGYLPEKPVIITFDDGSSGQMRAAAILEQYGYRGVFFVHPDNGLSPDQIRDLHTRGHEIGSHSYSHPFLTGVSDDQLWREVATSREALSQIIGSEIRYFAYPFGDWDERVISTVKAAGYCGAVHAWGGQYWTPDRRWTEPRIEIGGNLGMAGFIGLVTRTSQTMEYFKP